MKMVLSSCTSCCTEHVQSRGQSGFNEAGAIRAMTRSTRATNCVLSGRNFLSDAILWMGVCVAVDKNNSYLSVLLHAFVTSTIFHGIKSSSARL